MSSRRATDSGSSVLSFTFLDVLMCTMGSLLLLLVVFGVIAQKATRARRAGEAATISLAALTAPSAKASAGADPEDAAAQAAAENPDDLVKQIEALRVEQERLEQLRAEAAETRQREQDRIAHLEDHERRLEHELAKLNLALKALEEAEQKQNVDQVQADAERERLKKLVEDAEARLAEMRESSTEKSYAIVPYKGANGTFRRPVFIECTADAVTIQPEGIRLTVEDFDGPLRSGNPLAAAIRAAHEELNGRAVASGAVLPDAYPLLIVRPDGAAAYSAALDAIRSWDSDFGYEFVEADWKLAYPEPDPRLGQVMAHAVDEARQRQALLAQVAPGRYGPRLGAGGSGEGHGGGDGSDGGGDGSGGSGFVALSASGDGRMGSRASSGSLGGGPGGSNSLRGTGGSSASGGGNFSEEFTASAAGGTGTSPGAESTPGMLGAGATAAGRNGAAEGMNLGPRYASATGGAGGSSDTGTTDSQLASQTNGMDGATGDGGAAGQPGGGASNAGQPPADAAGGAAAGGSSDAFAASSAGGGDSGGGGTSSNMAGSTGRGASGNIGSSDEPSSPLTTARGSIADSRGVNWANVEASRRASAITRPVRIHVTAEQIDVPGDAVGGGSDATAISFHQPVDRVMDQLAGAVQGRVQEWGLAGDGMYWRPTLVVQVAPGAERQARRLAELLENSGIDVQLPEAVAAAPGGAAMRHDDEPEDDSMPGQDSFIDVICNMVGILITLVVVVGMRVSQMVIEPATEVTPVAAHSSRADVDKLKEELEEAQRRRRAAADEIETSMLQAADMHANAALVEMRREQLSIVQAQVEQLIEARRAALDADAQKQFDAQREISVAQVRLDQLMKEQISLLATPADVEEIETVPTPLAKTVSGDEIHVRLRHGQLAVIPVDALLNEVEARGGSYLRGGLQQRNEATDTYGPIDGFRLRLSVQRFEEPGAASAGGATPRRAAVVISGVFVPTADDVGMAVDQSLLPNSQFSQALRARRSAVGAVTAWVYPDSYAELRTLKKAMWEAGVPLAVRPLAENQPIIFSTLGSKSSAQ